MQRRRRRDVFERSGLEPRVGDLPRLETDELKLSANQQKVASGAPDRNGNFPACFFDDRRGFLFGGGK